MFRHLIMWAFICTTQLVSFSQNFIQNVEVDSIDYTLEEITVTPKSVFTKNDRRIVIPSKEKADASSSGIDLLQRMALPGISVNLMTGHISLTSGGELKIYVNGVPATESQIAVLDPDDIIRIEFHDMPGAKYGNVDAVLDYITRHKRKRGGRFFLESMDCIGNGKFATLDEIAWQHCFGTSVWSVNGGYMQMDRDNWVRNYDEIWHYPDHDVIRSEKGLPVRVGMSMFEGDISYNYRDNRGDMFNARLSLALKNEPAKENGDRNSWLSTSESADITSIKEHTSERSLQPALLLSYRHTFHDLGTLGVNIRASWLHSNSNHLYSESQNNTSPEEIISKTEAEKYRLSVDGSYEIALGPGTLSTGLSYCRTFSDNKYIGMNADKNTAIVKIDQSESTLFVEYGMQLDRWGLMGNLRAKRLSMSQDRLNIMKYALLPKASMSYRTGFDMFLRYSISVERKMPPIASISDVTQEIQPGIVRRGNPLVKSFRAIEQDFTLSYDNKYVKLNMTAGFLDESNPVMSKVLYENGCFVRTFANQPYFRKIHGEVSAAVTPFGNYLTLWVTPSCDWCFSRGTDYNLTKHIFLVNYGIDVTYKRLMLTACTMSGPENRMYGDEMVTEKPMNMVLIGYGGKKWSVQVGAFNLMKSYWMKTVNFSPLTPYVSDAHCGRNTYFAVKFSVNLNYGHNREVADMEIQPDRMVDMDSGVINGLK